MTSVAVSAMPVAMQVGHTYLIEPPVDVPPAGHAESTTWRGVAGATGARVSTSTMAVDPQNAGTGRSLGTVASAKTEVNDIVVVSPAPGAPIRGIRIPDLVRHEGEEELPIEGSGDLGGGLHLVLTPMIGGQVQAPLIAVPALPHQNALPAQLTGGGLSGSLFTLPDVIGTKFRITVVRGDAPEDFVEQPISYGDVTMYAAPMPVGLHVDGPDGAELFAMTGPITSNVVVDLQAAMSRHLDAAVVDGGPDTSVTTAVTIRSDVIGSAWVRWITTGGVIERKIDERLTADVTGATTSVALPPPDPGRVPTRTVADVTITHHGMAIHPISDAIPTTDAGLGGPVVRNAAVTRSLPPDALRDQHIRRACVIGWPLVETDLTLQVLGKSAAAAVLVAPTDRQAPSLVWFDFEDPPFVDGPAEFELTATRGAFGWIADPEPLLRVAVAATPSGEHVVVGGHTVGLTGDETVETGVVLSGTDGWTVVSDQFCTVSIANAVMEFAP
ncbi:MAG: hypothetical protein ABWZ42_05080 [Ilumatobacteraceae bacterium]